MKVSKLMHRDAITCRTHDTLARAAELMWEHDIGCLPVIDDAGAVAGMITDRDICMAAYMRGAPLTAIAVTGTMARAVYACSADDELTDVEEVMQKRQIRRMPVIDGSGHPIALISLNDIARAASGGGATAAAGLAATLAAVSAPRSLMATSR